MLRPQRLTWPGMAMIEDDRSILWSVQASGKSIRASIPGPNCKYSSVSIFVVLIYFFNNIFARICKIS